MMPAQSDQYRHSLFKNEQIVFGFFNFQFRHVHDGLQRRGEGKDIHALLAVDDIGKGGDAAGPGQELLLQGRGKGVKLFLLAFGHHHFQPSHWVCLFQAVYGNRLVIVACVERCLKRIQVGTGRHEYFQIIPALYHFIHHTNNLKAGFIEVRGGGRFFFRETVCAGQTEDHGTKQCHYFFAVIHCFYLL